MKYLNSNFINRVNTPEIREYFLNNFSELFSILSLEHSFKGRYHDQNNIIEVGFITTLMLYYHNGLVMKGMEEYNSLIKASLLQNYCYLNEDDDDLNLDLTIEKTYLLMKHCPHLFEGGEEGEILDYIALTHKELDVRPIYNPILSKVTETFHRILTDSYNLYPFICFTTKILNNLYLDKKERNALDPEFDIDAFKGELFLKFHNLNGERSTIFSKVVYKEIKSQFESLLISTEIV